jgi:hypothetical protein
MTEDESLERFGLTPDLRDASEIRAILRQETARERRQQGDGDTELMRLCCVQLFSLGDTEDILPIWQAKTSSFDANCSIEVHLLCGAGLDATKQYLSQQDTADSEKALAHISRCESAGDFDNFSRDGILDSYRRYYGL